MAAALTGLSLGLIIRHTAGAITVVALLMLGMAIVAASFSGNTAARYLPGPQEMAMVTPGYKPMGSSLAALAPGPATALAFGYLAVLLAAACILFRRRDV